MSTGGKKSQSDVNDDTDPDATNKLQIAEGTSSSCDVVGANVCYRIESSERLGRFLVATRDLSRGEIILQESPLAAAPQKSSPLICPGCFSSTQVECMRCGWPICSPECPGLSTHLEAECKLLSNLSNSTQTRKKLAYEKPGDWDWNMLQDSLMILRCLTLKSRDHLRWEQLIEMETNWEQWSRSPLFKGSTELATRLKRHFSLEESEDEILKVQAILDINAYEVKMPEVNIQGCYKLASVAEHSCVPNALKTTSSETLLLTLRAIRDVRKGEHIATTYCDVLWPTTKRQKYMQYSKFFICRCGDGTELGSFIGGLECPHCPEGALVPQQLNPSDISMGESGTATGTIVEEDEDVEDEDEEDERNLWENTNKDYHCHKCRARFACKGIQSFVLQAENQLHEVDQILANSTEDGIAALEGWLEQWTKPFLPKLDDGDGCRDGDDTEVDEGVDEPPRVFEKRGVTPRERRVGCSSSSLVFLHRHHSLALDACHTLFLLYSKDTSSISTLRRKDALGTHLLLATKNLFSGISMFRGTVMYELGLTKAAILARQLDQFQSPPPESSIKDKDLTTRTTTTTNTLAQEILWLLTESLDHLRFESADQPEGQLFTLGLKQLEELKIFLAQFLTPPNTGSDSGSCRTQSTS